MSFYKNSSYHNRVSNGIPVFFKFWFAFVAFTIIMTMILVVFLGIQIINVVSNPEAIGNYVGQIAQEFNEVNQQ